MCSQSPDFSGLPNCDLAGPNGWLSYLPIRDLRPTLWAVKLRAKVGRVSEEVAIGLGLQLEAGSRACRASRAHPNNQTHANAVWASGSYLPPRFVLESESESRKPGMGWVRTPSDFTAQPHSNRVTLGRVRALAGSRVAGD